MAGARGSREDGRCTGKSQRSRSGRCEREQHRCEEQWLHAWSMPCRIAHQEYFPGGIHEAIAPLPDIHQAERDSAVCEAFTLKFLITSLHIPCCADWRRVRAELYLFCI